MTMDEKTLRALVDAGAVKKIQIIGSGSRFHVTAKTPTGEITAHTMKGSVKNWSTLDATAKWVRSLGIGKMELNVSKWQPKQRGLKL
jgi:hypothetical protein